MLTKLPFVRHGLLFYLSWFITFIAADFNLFKFGDYPDLQGEAIDYFLSE